MSVLSKPILLSKLAARELIVSPILDDDQIQACAIDLRMGNVVLLSRSRSTSVVDPVAYRKAPPYQAREKDDSEHHDAQVKQQKLERYDVPFQQSFLLHPGILALVPTLEWVKLPNNVQGVVTARSSWAREGLSIATATFINPGYKGIITLELANLGEIPIKLFPGLRLAQIAMYELTPSGLVVDEKGEKKKKSQFDSQFEPTAGNLMDPAQDPFLPRDN